MRARLSFLALTAGFLLFGASPAEAQSGTVGLGIMIGDPTGLTLKFPLSANTAIDVGIGADTVNNFDNDDDAQVHVDWLFSPAILGRGNGFTVPIYFGIGGVVEFDDNGRNNDDLDIGVRVPVGIAFEFQRTPLELFLELGMEVLFIDNEGDEFDAGGVLGVRFYF